MAENLATRVPLPAYGIAGTFDVVRAEALFASTLQPSRSPSSDQVRRVVATTLRLLFARWFVFLTVMTAIGLFVLQLGFG